MCLISILSTEKLRYATFGSFSLSNFLGFDGVVCVCVCVFVGWCQAGGFFGIFTAIIAWYLALAGLLTHDNSYFTLPVGNLNRRR